MSVENGLSLENVLKIEFTVISDLLVCWTFLLVHLLINFSFCGTASVPNQIRNVFWIF